MTFSLLGITDRVEHTTKLHFGKTNKPFEAATKKNSSVKSPRVEADGSSTAGKAVLHAQLLCINNQNTQSRLQLHCCSITAAGTRTVCIRILKHLDMQLQHMPEDGRAADTLPDQTAHTGHTAETTATHHRRLRGAPMLVLHQTVLQRAVLEHTVLQNVLHSVA